MISKYYVFVIVFIGLLNACSTPKQPPQQLPMEQIAHAKLAINKAADSQAQVFAGHELNEARQHLQNAQQAIQNQAYELAIRSAEKAVVAAKLAEAKAEYELARQAIQSTRSSVTDEK